MAGPQPKKRKMEIQVPIPVRLSEMKQSLEMLRMFSRKDGGIFLVLIKILSCNANQSPPFSVATCKSELQNNPVVNVFPLSAIYRTGIELLNDFLVDRKEPRNEEHWDALKALMDFVSGPEIEHLATRLQKDKWMPNLQKDDKKEWTAAQKTIILLHHILSKLTVIKGGEPAYVVDKNCQNNVYWCPCCCERISGQYDDTSIGNTKVWHGRIDAMINRNVSMAQLDNSDEDSDEEHDNESDQSSRSRSSRSSVSAISEVKMLKQKDVNQVIAQTITFSFLEHSKHPEQVPLYGNISIKKNFVQFQFYDSVHDILLEGNQVDLFDKKKNLSFSVVIGLWLLVNHSLFCTGVVQEMKNLSFTADFLKDEEDVKNIFKNELAYHCGLSKDLDRLEDKIRIWAKRENFEVLYY